MQRCDNCNQTALEGDTVCWQCGRPLPGSTTSSQPAAVEGRADKATSTTTAVWVYGFMTAVVVTLTLLVTFSLGRLPLVQLTVRDRMPAGWRPVTAVGQAFTLDLPEDWQWYDSENSQQALALEMLLAQHELLTATTQPWSAIDPNLEIIFLAHSPPRAGRELPTTLVVARSPRLRQVDEERTLTVAEATGHPLLESRVVAAYDKSHAYFVAPIWVSGEEFRCRQQVIPGAHEALILSACSRQEQSGLDRVSLTRILDSFQRLTP